MRKFDLKALLLLLAALPLAFLLSCSTEEDDDDGNPDTGDSFLPVLDDNFSFTVNGNTVSFTTTLSGNVWVTTNDVDYAFVDKAVEVSLPNKGTYSFTCSSLGSGAVLTSDVFSVEIAQDDLAFLNEGVWKYLSGGANATKTWKMDLNAEGKSVYFAGPVFYSGNDAGPYWAWDVAQSDIEALAEGTPYVATLDDGSTAEMTSLFNWSPDYASNTWLMAAADYGTITFDATNGTVKTSIFGADTEGSFSFDDETYKLTLNGVILPTDTARLNEGQFTAEDLANVRIFSISDSSMQIGIKRSYEGFEEDEVTQVESRWTMVYNFIVADYNYPVPEEFTFEEPIKADFAAADLEGSWNYAAVPFDWVGWKSVGNQGTVVDAAPLNGWADAAAMISTEWLGITQEQLDAAAAQEFVFGNDGSATVGDVTTTYTVDAGMISFADSVTFNVADHWYSVKSTSFTVLDVPNAEGIWIGIQNGDKNESAAVNIVKQ